ncbi:ComF family protein [Zymomonas mobilis]|uniref:Phosphoribosyltransferase n=1 Tax=Zymomonas mobilis subsp. pomaceae (strain ATCC 29192 / DSM 22645 / JCM 10191 / CCUG 17912 / NBRC 13757 / NCIMB 11200 / NRRL B-4491 / Barker I) TaxID=579138 RepID=F8ETM9_ZYMMT|nr:ComF family protein [Zymomonas mobilis]AEI37039.1 phosphoribosyltransferase [Zymomonas mobilis subsp. pomaceae ATCC 29192]MDX5948411.1 ComF family protein [Zymomonas mobilis subsp. pomaceae]GEB89599.1 amidophosphoribosyltransferase [Zymomonas mobilis subsp. pomaceae]
MVSSDKIILKVTQNIPIFYRKKAETIFKTIRKGIEPFIRYALPPRCLGCGDIVTEDHAFCPKCWQSLNFLLVPTCIQCGLPLSTDLQYELRCARCLHKPPSFDRMNAVVAYGETAKGLVLRCKYGKQTMLAYSMAKLMRRFVVKEPDKQLSSCAQKVEPFAEHQHHYGQEGYSSPIALSDSHFSEEIINSSRSENPLIIPVPLHRWRLWQRGFNQTALIAKALAKMSGFDYDFDILCRIKSTANLGRFNAKQRLNIVKNAFAVRFPKNGHNPIKGRNIILIDDVFTTGATTESCAKILKKAGAHSVHVICWARVIPDEYYNNPL